MSATADQVNAGQPGVQGRPLVELCGKLYEEWRRETGHSPGSRDTLACRIYRTCGEPGQHIGFACSLSYSGNEIAAFLKFGKELQDPVTFAKLLLIMLHEFTDGMCAISARSGMSRTIKQPQRLSVWANNWAKHRVQILLQHHPMELLSDLIEGDDPAGLVKAGRVEVQGANGRIETHKVVSDADLRNIGTKSSPKVADSEQWVIVVPKLADFLLDTIKFYTQFVELCCKNRDIVAKYSTSRCNLIQFKC